MVNLLPMPKLGMTMLTGKILNWLRGTGDSIKKGDIILEIETDKVSIKAESPFEGSLLKIIAEKGAVVPINHTIALIGNPGEDLTEALKQVEKQKQQAPPPKVSARAKKGEKAKQAGTPEKVLASPRARALAQQYSIDLSTISSNKPGGEIVEADVIRAMAQRQGTRPAPPVKLHPSLTVKEEVDVEGIRKVIADRMYYSLQSAAQLTLTLEVDMSEVVQFRARVMKETGEHISFTDVLIFVTAAVLGKYPKFNASVDPSGEYYSIIQNINIGIATAADKGLLVPVLRDADKKSLPEIARGARDLTSRTRSDKATLDELAGGTFTITNLGMFGIDGFTPIVNPPEIAILGVGQIVEKTIASKGAVIVHPMMVLSLSFDHRIIDGHEGAIFLQELKQTLESPQKLTQLHNRMMFREVQSSQAQAMLKGQLDALAIVIGCGPAGQAFAERMTEIGGKVIVVEKDLLGGTCLNRGCIPVRAISRTLQLKHELELAQEKGLGLTITNCALDFPQVITHKNDLVQTLREGLIRSFEQQKIEVIHGTARVVGPNEVEIQTAEGKVRKKTKYIVIATGAHYTSLPAIARTKTIPASSSELLDLTDIPSSLLLVGNDYITATFASIFAELGSKVTILCPTSRLLPDFEEDVIDGLIEELGFLDVKVMTNVQIVGVSRTKVIYKGDKADQSIEGARIANLSYRAGNGAELGLEAAGVSVNDGFITVTNGFETGVPSIYAIGDITSTPWRLSHKASEEGRILAEVLMGNKLSVNYAAIPKIVFSRPMVAAVGMTEAQLKERKSPHKVFRFPVARNSFAHVCGEIGGMLKILADPSTGVILGVSVIGIFASELIAECALAIKEKMTIEQLALVPQVHPSIAELLKDAMYAFRNQVEKE